MTAGAAYSGCFCDAFIAGDALTTIELFKFIRCTSRSRVMCSFEDDISIPLSLSDPELLELVSSEMPDEEQSEMILPRSHRALKRLGVLRRDLTVTVKSFGSTRGSLTLVADSTILLAATGAGSG